MCARCMTSRRRHRCWPSPIPCPRRSPRAAPSCCPAAAMSAPDREPYKDRIVRFGDTSPEGLREKVVFVIDEMERRLKALGFGWQDAVSTQAYTVQNIGHLVGEELAQARRDRKRARVELRAAAGDRARLRNGRAGHRARTDPVEELSMKRSFACSLAALAVAVGTRRARRRAAMGADAADPRHHSLCRRRHLRHHRPHHVRAGARSVSASRS